MFLDKVGQLFIPLSQQQKEIYLDHINREDTTGLNIGGYVEINQPININNLECAIKETLQEHTILRCSIIDRLSMAQTIDPDNLEDTVEFAHVVKDHHFELSHLDLSGEDEAESKALVIVEQIFSEPFRLEQDVLYRVGLIQLAINRFWLYFISHHIIIDGVGYANWLRHIFDTYQQLNLGNAPRKNIGEQFLDFAAQPIPENYSQQFARSAHYWKELLRYLPDVPFQCRKETTVSTDLRKNSRLIHFIGPDSYKSFLTRAKQGNLPILPLFITAIASFVNRINQSDRVLIGTPLHNRITSAQRNMVGSFMSMLPVMCVQNEHSSVAEAVALAARTIKNGYRYRSYPLSALYKDLSLRAKGRERLFEIVFNYQQIDFDFSASELKAETNYLSHGREDIPLTITLCEYGDKQSTQLQLDYRHDYFSSLQAESLLQSIMTLVEQMVAQPATLLTSLNLVDKEAEQKLWNLSQSTEEENLVRSTTKLAHELIEQCAERYPDAIAIVDGERQMSYTTLNHQANQLADYLIELGARPDSRIAICLPRSSDMVVAMLATLKAGAAYVPMDHEYPDGRLLFMLTDAQPVVCITLSSIAHRFAAANITTLLLDDVQLNAQLAQRSTENLSAGKTGLQSEHLAYVIYTSGTTGQPKGVMVEHKQLSHFIAHITRAYRLTEHDKFLQFSSVSFDISVEECFGSLCNGGTLVLRPDHIHYDFAEFWAFCRHHEISVTSLPTAFWHQLVNYSRQPIDSSLRLVILGGEMVKSASVREWFEHGPAVELINTYGPTETTVTASAYSMTSLTDVTATIPIGKANASTQLYLLDTNLKSVPAGFQGELYIGGAGVTRGYLNREQESAKSFVLNPFGVGRLYRTGDIARQLPDGHLAFIGRNDNQVKINGFRIEPEEISNQLMGYPGIYEAVVYPRQLGADDRMQLIAYVVAEGTLNINAVRLAMKSKLADYMLPVAIVQLEKLPLTQNGKLDFKQLPLPQKQDYSQQEYVAPEGDAERVLAQLWQSLLALDKVSRHDNFFALGGHSLLIMSLRAGLAQRGYELPMRAIYRTDTLAELALHLVGIRKDENASSHPEMAVNKLAGHVEHITPDMLDMVTLSEKEIAAICRQVEGGAGNIQDIYPLSPLQEGIFFHHRMSEAHDPYIIPILIKFSDQQKLASFLHALDKVVERHDVFRTSIHWQDLATSVQVVHRTATVPLHWQVVTPGLSALETLQQVALERHDMQLDRAPMMQAIAVKGAETETCFLLLKQHHLLSDQISVLLQIEEMQALLEDPTAVLPTPVQYREFVAHSLRVNQSDKGVDYFKTKLSGIVETTAPFGLLNVYHDGLAVDSAGELAGPHLAQQIIGLASQRRISTANIFHLAWALVVAKCSGKDDIVFGSMMSGRMQAIRGSDRILGMLINLLPVRINLVNLSVDEALTQMSDELIELTDYEHFPLSEALRYSSLPGTTPLFTSLLNFRHKNKLAMANQSHHFDIIEAREYTNYPLEMGIDQLDNDFMMQVHVEPQVGAVNVLTYMRTALVAIINALNQAPQTSLLTLSITPINEQQRIINAFNSPVVVYDKTATVHQRFECQAAKTPAAIAAVCGVHRMTYTELNQRANQLAHYLIDQGVAQNHVVAIYAERSVEFVIAMLSIMKAGAAYVPLDPTNPQDRLSYMLADSGVEVVLTQSHLNGLAFNGQQHFLLDTDWLSLAHYPNTNPEVVCCPDDLAYMIYTSGSTGKPKGALVHHAGALNHIDAEFDVLGFMDRDNRLLPRNFLQSAASSSDVSVWQFLAPLMSGGKTVILPNAMDLPEYVRALQNEQIHLIQTAPSVLKILLEHFLNKGGVSIPLPDLKWLMIIAEPCPVPLVNCWLQNYPQIPVMNGYGPSEASDDITYFIIDEPLTEQVKNIPVGKPLPNLTMYVLDQHMQILPVNVVGELCVSGIGVGKGYWNNPEKTADSFKDNPFYAMGGHGTKLYRTGDLGYWRADGYLELIGRIDNQVKIRGFRVELGEIESALVKLPQVTEAAVLVHKDRVGENCLVAYLVLAGHAGQVSSSIDEIKQGLNHYLPDYMIPAYYEILDKMPLNAADKINRHALPQPGFINHHAKWVAPATELEQSLADIWQSVLNVDQIGRNDNFFHLGGHSLLVIRVISKIRAELGRDIAVKAMFDHPTLIELATMLKQQTVKTVVDSIQKQPRNDELLPLSFAQERLWILSQIDQNSAEYNMPVAFAVKGKFDIRAAELALNQIIERHEILRTVYIKQEGRPFQQVLSGRELRLNYVDLSYLSKEQQDWHVAELMTEDISRIFDLSNDLMIRATFIQRQANNGVLLFNAHHIASDGWSEDILIREFIGRYEAISNGKHFEIDDLEIQYVDFAVWQRSRLQGEYLASQINYWKQQLSGLPPVHNLPLDRPRPKVRQYQGAVVVSMLPEETTRSLVSLARRHQMTPFMLFHAALALVLSRHSNSHDIVIGTPVANRLQPELERLIGFFVNTLILRVDTRQGALSDYFAHIRQVHLDAQQNQDVPFEQLVERLLVTRNTAYTPLFQIMLTMNTDYGLDHDVNTAAFNLPEVELSAITPNYILAQFDLDLELSMRDQGLFMHWTYDTSLFSHQHIEQLNDHLSRLLGGLAKVAETDLASVSPADLPMLSEAETQYLLHTLKDTRADYSDNACIHSKPDHKIWPELNITHDTSDDFVEPMGETETLLAEIWQAVLNISQVSRNDNFFAIGGHSLLAIKLAAEINSVFSIEFSVMQVFHTPNLPELAQLICNQQLQEKIKSELITAGEGGWL
ncbi:non-ribosomal peptide synthetase [Xenorhabdus nematophila]|uniref:Non-ribosomal peptide synthetase involved in odilorhabdin synthesis n=1 Tax=Xenorhabdus nematophila TaxID=628 RepID=A0A2I2MK36_XENNE|nr:non-ribosomal peptide synthetase [Xenorhabdus nematophila]CEF31717.1 putative Ornithine racemase [Xenorhabdus nematophila str. Websteri]AYA40115.1 non-ribosomal peptide synthetase [Xenorhabdus nematophila]MBA0018764.1 non-ribosomal peptide synthetase [Xenorhabdus nematophila]MCB4424473.1 non-ribosomal peptide synthetase [Xenorhabdus nematophila]QNJ37760.1 non-ribosomal peptide synthetase [Xenorhabdus nematophila]